ncbi:MAG: hypothetical protein H0U35_13890 [Sporichthyaceae bacterium]|nr:hypothetical protein [Sporichthyaceae bacterium]
MLSAAGALWVGRSRDSTSGMVVVSIIGTVAHLLGTVAKQGVAAYVESVTARYQFRVVGAGLTGVLEVGVAVLWATNDHGDEPTCEEPFRQVARRIWTTTRGGKDHRSPG